MLAHLFRFPNSFTANNRIGLGNNFRTYPNLFCASKGRGKQNKCNYKSLQTKINLLSNLYFYQILMIRINQMLLARTILIFNHFYIRTIMYCQSVRNLQRRTEHLKGDPIITASFKEFEFSQWLTNARLQKIREKTNILNRRRLTFLFNFFWFFHFQCQ